MTLVSEQSVAALIGTGAGAAIGAAAGGGNLTLSLTEINLTRPTRVLLSIARSGRFNRAGHVSFLRPDGLQADEWKWASVQRLRERGSEGEKRTA